MKRQSRQVGFSIVEALIVVVAIGVIGTAGWFVYQHNRPKPTNAASNPSHSSSQQTQQPTASPSSTTQYFTIKEWGVEAPYSGSLKLSYTMSADGKSAIFSSDQLSALSSDCVGKGGAIGRWSKDDLVSEGPPTSSTPTAANYFAAKDPLTYKHIADYYYMFVHVQSGCGNIDSTAATQSQTNDAVESLVPNLQAIPN